MEGGGEGDFDGFRRSGRGGERVGDEEGERERSRVVLREAWIEERKGSEGERVEVKLKGKGGNEEGKVNSLLQLLLSTCLRASPFHLEPCLLGD